MDTREKKNEDILQIFNRFNVPYKESALVAGDYALGWLGDKWYHLFERKRILDLYLSIKDYRMVTQPPRIALLSHRPAIAVVGDTKELEHLKEEYNVDFNPNILYGELASLYVRYGMDLFWFRDDVQFGQILVRIFKKLQEGKEGVPHRGIKTGYYRNPEARKVHFLGGITGLTPKISLNLLDHFGGIVKNILLAPEEELRKVEGIGEDRAGRVWRLINE